MRFEITHTIKASDYTAFMRAYNEALEVDRKSRPDHQEPRVMVAVFGELNRIRIELEFDTPPQAWIDNGCPSFIEMADEHYEGFLKLAERTEVQWLKDVDLAAV
jgi:hypothetical protein